MALPRLRGPAFDTNKAAPFPSRMDCKLNYSITNNLSTSTTQYAIGTPYSCPLNDLANTPGHQPYGFDTLQSIYRNFRVTHADVEVEITANLTGTSDLMGLLISFLPNGATYPAAGDTLDRWGEVPGVFTKVLGLTGSASVLKIRQRVPIAAIEGLNPAQMVSSSDYASIAAGTVPYSPELHIACSNESSTSARGMTMKVNIVFTATFWNRKQLAQS